MGSTSVDIVVYSSFAPLIGHNKKPLFLAQGTFVAIEVKSVLSYISLGAALEWSRKIKRLTEFSLPEETGIPGLDGTTEGICTGVFAYKSHIGRDKILDKIPQYHESGVPNYEMIDFVWANTECCMYRSRTESLAGFHSINGETTLEQRRKACTYMTSPYLFGPTPPMLGTYLHPR